MSPLGRRKFKESCLSFTPCLPDFLIRCLIVSLTRKSAGRLGIGIVYEYSRPKLQHPSSDFDDMRIGSIRNIT